MADKADDSDISIYTVFYDENNDDAGATFFEDLVRGEGGSSQDPGFGRSAGPLRQPLRPASADIGSMNARRPTAPLRAASRTPPWLISQR
jgi:hypothetical protein